MRFVKIARPCSLRARLYGVFALGMALSAGLVALAWMAFVGTNSELVLRKDITRYAKILAQQLVFDAAGHPTGLDDTKIENWVLKSFDEEMVLAVVDDQGRVAYTPHGITEPLVADGARFDPELRQFALVRQGLPMHAATATRQHAGRTWYLQFGTSDRVMREMRQAFGVPALRQGIVATCAIFLVIFLVTMHFTLRRALKPLREASDAARQITPRRLDARLDAAAQPVEVRPLVEGFNHALDRLQHGFRTQQEFLSNAAHELKTPLALIRAQVELGPRDERNRHILQDVDRMARQVQQLLLLAEVSEPQNFRIGPADPRATIQEVFDYMARVAERHAVYLGLRIDVELRHWNIDRGALFTLLKNLLENAIQHSPAGGVVTLAAGPGGFSVTDHGPGVSEEDLPRLFERFWRGADRRDEGAGLGLPICREIALAHGWDLQLRRQEQGLEVRAVMGGAAQTIAA